MAGETVQPPRRNATSAWLSLVLFAPCFVAAFWIGEGLIAALGFEVGGPVHPPLWAGMLATVPALVAFALPLWPTWHFGRRAVRDGRRAGMVPFMIAGVVVLIFVVLNTVPLGQ